jgi:hypothetical protein
MKARRIFITCVALVGIVVLAAGLTDRHTELGAP